LFLLLVAGPAGALDIFINGNQVTGLKDVTITGCTVVFDAAGNLRIAAPGYQIVREGEEPPPPPPPAAAELTERYFVYTTTNSVGSVPFLFTVWVNGAKVLDVDVQKNQTAVEITEHLRRGINELRIEARHHSGGSGDAAHEFLVAVGKGSPREGLLRITQQIAAMARKGNDSSSGVQEFQIDAR
jgi:hypothetical protein